MKVSSSGQAAGVLAHQADWTFDEQGSMSKKGQRQLTDLRILAAIAGVREHGAIDFHIMVMSPLGDMSVYYESLIKRPGGRGACTPGRLDI
ncbi:MAG: hypothetical protein Q4E24_11315 [bacterium]|nr:hypothetical protein [bacterium]